MTLTDWITVAMFLGTVGALIGLVLDSDDVFWIGIVFLAAGVIAGFFI